MLKFGEIKHLFPPINVQNLDELSLSKNENLNFKLFTYINTNTLKHAFDPLTMGLNVFCSINTRTYTSKFAKCLLTDFISLLALCHFVGRINNGYIQSF